MRPSEKVLCLDISTKTGTSLGLASENDYKLLKYGTVGKLEKPDIPYPEDYVSWAEKCAGEIIEIINKSAADVIVIEETTGGSKSNFSQKILEFIHFLVAKHIVKNGLAVRYLMTGTWREAAGARMTKEESKQNAKSRKIKKETGARLAKDESGKILGKITKKHVNVRRANEIFGLDLKMKDNDAADAILLGAAYYEIEWRRQGSCDKDRAE